MKVKIKSKTKINKFIYGNVLKNKTAHTFVVFLSGFSGSKDLTLFKKATQEFFKHKFDTLAVDFCVDNDDAHPKKNALKLEDISFLIYIRELKNIIDIYSKKYSRIVFVGHSFGAIVAMLFLVKNKGYAKNTELVLWEPSLLPWNKKEMEKDFVFDNKKKLFYEKKTNIVINKVFYKELASKRSLDTFKVLNKRACIVAAEGSADKDAERYFLKIRNKKSSKLIIIKNTDHFFNGKKAQAELFKKTIDYIK